MKLISIYECLCDETRLRILNLLSRSPLCVCHLQAALGKSQVVMSQHLAYLRERKLVVGQRHQNWMIYSLPEKQPRALKLNLRCLRDTPQAEPVFRRDLRRFEKLMGDKSARALLDEGCCARPAPAASRRPAAKTKRSSLYVPQGHQQGAL